MRTRGSLAVPPVDVRAAGAVLWRPGGDRPELALVHRPRYDDWSFPKGKLDRGEAMAAAAVREVAEETGARARLGAALGEVRYSVPEGNKVVRYWAAEARGGEFAPNSETDELRWVCSDRAAELLSYSHDRDVLHRFTAVGVPTAVVLLVRHAKAGNRQQWDGPDIARPLSGTGREQARQLAGLLRLFGPDRLASAPPARCTETLAPLAAALGGVPVAEEPLFAEQRYGVDPAAGRARLRELAAQPGVTVVCSQGGVIPDLVGDLVAGTGRRFRADPAEVGSRKASTWVLTFDASTLRSADYYAYPTG